MSIDRKHYKIALISAERIRRYWRQFKEDFFKVNKSDYPYEEVEVKVMPTSYEIVSNIVNGYPPQRST